MTFFISIDTARLVDCVDLICSLYSWWRGFRSSSLAALLLGFNCGFISNSAYGSSTGVCSWGYPGGLVSALWGPGAEVVQLLGSQQFWQHQVLRGVGSYGGRKYSALEGHSNQYTLVSCLEKPPNREARQATVYRVTKSWTWLKLPWMHRFDTFFFFACGSSGPLRIECEGGTAACVMETLVLSLRLILTHLHSYWC